jgi:hypothetical protein
MKGAFDAQPRAKTRWKLFVAIGVVDEPPIEGWICPAMFPYFKSAPKTLCVMVGPTIPGIVRQHPSIG